MTELKLRGCKCFHNYFPLIYIYGSTLANALSFLLVVLQMLFILLKLEDFILSTLT